MTVIEYLQDLQTRNKIIDLIRENIFLYQGINTDKKIQDLTGVLYNKFVEECVQNNQYISLSNKSITNINEIYQTLIFDLRGLIKKEYTRADIEDIVIDHRGKLIHELTNNVFSDKTRQIYIPCAEYTPEFQQKILKLPNRKLPEPILDIGCGKHHGLINSLKESGYHIVYGIDQYTSSEPSVICCNWFEYEFEKRTFGTVLAHMSFTNHFRRSIILDDDKRGMYQDKYFEILESLRAGGLFIYTPAVKQVEKELDTTNFKITYHRNTKDENLDTVTIERSSLGRIH